MDFKDVLIDRLSCDIGQHFDLNSLGEFNGSTESFRSLIQT